MGREAATANVNQFCIWINTQFGSEKEIFMSMQRIQTKDFLDGAGGIKWFPCDYATTQTDSIIWELIYDESKRHFMVVNADDEWMPINEAAAKRHLKVRHNVSSAT